MPPLGHGAACGCLNCPPRPAAFPMDGIIVVGFGQALVTKNGAEVLDGEWYHSIGKTLTGRDAEVCAAESPDHDWRISFLGPMSEAVYQRHGVEEWNLVKTGMGFA